jgi:mycoredoxin
VCRRELAQGPARPIALADAGDRSGSGLGSRLVTGLLALAAVATFAGFLLLQSRNARSDADASAAASPARAARGLSQPAAAPAAGPALDPTGKDAPRPSVAPTAVPADQPGAVPAAAVLPPPLPPAALEPPPPPNPVAAPDSARAEDERRHAEVMAAIAARERARATGSVAITMYSTSWCGACIAARDHMRAKGIAFTEHDVEADPAAKAQQLQLNPRGGVPTIDVDGRETLVGFSAQRLEAAIARSVAARTGG